jgi:hypothetical protein
MDRHQNPTPAPHTHTPQKYYTARGSCVFFKCIFQVYHQLVLVSATGGVEVDGGKEDASPEPVALNCSNEEGSDRRLHICHGAGAPPTLTIGKDYYLFTLSAGALPAL